MNISNRTLRKWRKDALLHREVVGDRAILSGYTEATRERVIVDQGRLLRLTQILMDKNLLEGKK